MFPARHPNPFHGRPKEAARYSLEWLPRALPEAVCFAGLTASLHLFMQTTSLPWIPDAAQSLLRPSGLHLSMCVGLCTLAPTCSTSPIKPTKDEEIAHPRTLPMLFRLHAFLGCNGADIPVPQSCRAHPVRSSIQLVRQVACCRPAGTHAVSEKSTMTSRGDCGAQTSLCHVAVERIIYLPLRAPAVC